MQNTERSAWAWFICLLIAPTSYFILTSNIQVSQGDYDMMKMKFLSVALGVMALTAISMHIYNYRLKVQGLIDSMSERVQKIDQHGTNKAYPVLIGGMILVGFVMPFNASKWEMIDAAYFSIVLAELVHYGFVLLAYRKDAALT